WLVAGVLGGGGEWVVGGGGGGGADVAMERIILKGLRLDISPGLSYLADGRHADLLVRDSLRQLFDRSSWCTIDGHVVNVTELICPYPARVGEALSGVGATTHDKCSVR